MRSAWLLGLASSATAMLGACGGDDAQPTGDQHVNLVLDIPNAVLDPMGYTSVEVTLHDSSGDSVRSADVDSKGRFDLGAIDPRPGVWIEAALRNDSGAAVGYGRSATPNDIEDGADIVVPVRRPIAYIAGPTQNLADKWVGLPATFADLSAGAPVDGATQMGAKPTLVVTAGPRLFTFDQDLNMTTGVLQGMAAMREVSTGDHTFDAPTLMIDAGILQDGAGADDGTALVIGTSTKLLVIDHAAPAAPALRADAVAHEVADGNFSRVAIVGRADGTQSAIAIANRGLTTGPCTSTAELWYIPDLASPEAMKVATGGFTDVAADAGHVYYLEACKAELGEVTAGALHFLRADLTTTGVRATALAVTNGQAYIGLEKPGTAGTTSSPAVTTLVVTPVESNDPPRALWSEAAQQVLRAVEHQGVERRLDAQAATFQQLELGAGGDYVAAVIASKFHGEDVDAANFPTMDVVTEELRVFDASTGGTVQRYRSWCDGSFMPDQFDIDMWACSVQTGQTEPADPDDEHRVLSMSFLFGKK